MEINTSTKTGHIDHSQFGKVTRRWRQLYDILELAIMFIDHQRKRYTSIGDEAILNDSKKLSNIANISQQGARGVLRISNITSNAPLMEFLRRHTLLRVLSAHEFTETVLDKTRLLSMDPIDVVEAFSASDTFLKSTNTRLLFIASQYHPAARNLVVLHFFHFVAIIATICGWVESNHDLEIEEIESILKAYCSETWNSLSMRSQGEKNFSSINMLNGWRVVHAMVSFHVEELFNLILMEDEKRTGEPKTFLEDFERVSVSDVQKDIVEWFHSILLEVLTWMYSRTPGTMTRYKFIELLKPVIPKVFTKVLCEVGFKDPHVALQERRLFCLLSIVDDGGPTIPQSFYSENSSAAFQKYWKRRETTLDSCKEFNRERKAYENNAATSKSLAHGVGVSIIQTEVNYSTIPCSWFNHEIRPLRINVPIASSQLSKWADVPCGRAPYRTSTYFNKKKIPAWMSGEGRKSIIVIDDRSLVDSDDGGTNTPPQLQKTVPVSENALVGAGNGIDIPVFNQTLSPIGNIDNYGEDGACSDLEVHNNNRSDLQNGNLTEQLEIWYAEFLRWRVDPKDKSVSNLITSNKIWLKMFIKKKKEQFVPDVTSCVSCSSFSGHWKAFLTIEVRGHIMRALCDMFPSINSGGKKFMEEVFAANNQGMTQFFRFSLLCVTESQKLIKMQCLSSQRKISEKDLDKFCNMSLCIGYIEDEKEKRRKPTSLMLFLCRSVSVNNDCLEQNRNHVQVSLCANRHLLRTFNPRKNDVVFLRHVCSLTSLQRMYSAVHEIYRLPSAFLCILFKNNENSLQGNEISRNRENNTLNELQCKKTNNELQNFQNMSSLELEEGVDPKSLQCLKNCLNDDHVALDENQYTSVLKALKNIGDCNEGSSSLTMIEGPPGTGKTNCILTLITSLIHHSKVGHMIWKPRNMLRHNDRIYRSSPNPDGIRILVCCSSNEGTDNAMRALKHHGLQDGSGIRLFPQMIRMAKDGFDYEDLHHLSLNEVALSYDQEMFHQDEDPRRYASRKAKRHAVEECIVLFITLSFTGSSMFSDLRTQCDVIIIDDATQVLEPEVCIPLVATRKSSARRRLHVVCLGDQNQLSPVSRSIFFVNECDVKLPFSYNRQITSQFERLTTHSRCPTTMLTKQYRMHPVIWEAHNSMYSDAVESPMPAIIFEDVYNQYKKYGKGYEPFTIVDTSRCCDRSETNLGNGDIRNFVEVQQVEEIINNLVCLKDAIHFRNKIAVIAPYQSQVDAILDHLNIEGRVFPETSVLKHLLVQVTTVDSMQGAEKDIVIFSTTRSNKNVSVGFLKDWRRLNVAVTRGKKLVVIIADLSTVEDRLSMFKQYIKKCRRRLLRPAIFPARIDNENNPILYTERTNHDLRLICPISKKTRDRK